MVNKTDGPSAVSLYVGNFTSTCWCTTVSVRVTAHLGSTLPLCPQHLLSQGVFEYSVSAKGTCRGFCNRPAGHLPCIWRSLCHVAMTSPFQNLAIVVVAILF